MSVSFWERLKTLNRRGLAREIWPDYVFGKWIFRSALVLCLILAVGIMISEDFDFSQHVYFSCPDDGIVCENPFRFDNYKMMGDPVELCPDADLCAIEMFGPGESYGRSPGFLMDRFGWIVFFIWFSAFGLNHYQNNRGWVFAEEKDSDL